MAWKSIMVFSPKERMLPKIAGNEYGKTQNYTFLRLKYL